MTKTEIKIKEIKREEAVIEGRISYYQRRVVDLQRWSRTLSDEHLKLLCHLAAVAMLKETPDERKGRIREAKRRAENNG